MPLKNHTVKYENEDEYKGDVDDEERPHGKGTYTHQNEEDQVQQGVYVGEWKDGKKHGKGIHRYRNGDVYDGPWKEGKRDGPKGKYTYYNKTTTEYFGEWEKDKKNGQGTMQFANGDVYKGDWLKNNMHADKATYIWKDRSQYVGPFKNDNKHGKGTLTYANGDVYEGMFDNGKRQGRGKYTFHKGITKEGLYDDDNRVGDIGETANAKQKATTTSSQYDQLSNSNSSRIEEPAD